MKQKSQQREKVSVAGALWLSPLRDRLGLPFQALVNEYFTNVEVAEFLHRAVQWLDAPMPVEQVWTWLKYLRLCNFPPRDAIHLNEVLISELNFIRDDQHRLRILRTWKWATSSGDSPC